MWHWWTCMRLATKYKDESVWEWFSFCRNPVNGRCCEIIPQGPCSNWHPLSGSSKENPKCCTDAASWLQHEPFEQKSLANVDYKIIQKNSTEMVNSTRQKKIQDILVLLCNLPVFAIDSEKDSNFDCTEYIEPPFQKYV